MSIKTLGALTAPLVLASSHVLAQAGGTAGSGTTGAGTAPSAAGTAAGSGLGSYWWVIVLILIVIAVGWFMRGRNRPL